MTATDIAGIYGAVMSTVLLGLKVALEVREYRKRKRWRSAMNGLAAQQQFDASRGLGGIYGGKP